MNSISEMIEVKKDQFYSIAESRVVMEMTICGMSNYIRQHPIGPYFADFYFPDKDVVLEIDGKDYHSSPEQIKHDRVRDDYMNKKGLIVIRATGSMANTNPSGVLACVRVIDRIETYFIKDNEDIKAIQVYFALKNKL